MVTATADAEIYYTTDGSDPDPLWLAPLLRAGGADMVEGTGTRRYKLGRAVVLEHEDDGYRDFVVNAVAMTADMRQVLKFLALLVQKYRY